MSDMYGDAVMACADLAGRAGAREFEMGWTCPHVPDEPDDHTCPEVTWHAQVSYQGARVMTGECNSPTAAAMDLAERLLRGATCRCRQPVALSDDRPGCRWQLLGKRWEPSCDVPSVRVEGERGDHAAMERALAGQPANRAERRAAKKRGAS